MQIAYHLGCLQFVRRPCFWVLVRDSRKIGAERIARLQGKHFISVTERVEVRRGLEAVKLALLRLLDLRVLDGQALGLGDAQVPPQLLESLQPLHAQLVAQEICH